MRKHGVQQGRAEPHAARRRLDRDEAEVMVRLDQVMARHRLLDRGGERFRIEGQRDDLSDEAARRRLRPGRRPVRAGAVIGGRPHAPVRDARGERDAEIGFRRRDVRAAAANDPVTDGIAWNAEAMRRASGAASSGAALTGRDAAPNRRARSSSMVPADPCRFGFSRRGRAAMTNLEVAGASP